MSSYKIIILPGKSDFLIPYKSMIYSDFMKSLRYGNPWFKLIDQRCFFQAYEKLITYLFEMPEIEIRLAVLSDDNSVCLGWSISDRSRLHYVFVKKDFQRQGIGRSLMPRGFESITHLTKVGKIIWKKNYKKVIFNPFF